MLKTKIHKTAKLHRIEDTLSEFVLNNGGKRKNATRELYAKNWKNFLNSPVNSLEERRSIRQLIRLNWQIQSFLLGQEKDVIEHKLRADWMTRQSVDLFGAPNVSLTKKIMKHDIDYLRSVHLCSNRDIDDYHKLCAVYEKLGVLAGNESPHYYEKAITAEEDHLKEFLIEKYGFILENIHPDKVYNVRETADMVRSVLHEFAKTDVRFSGWSVKTNDSEHLSVSTEEKTICIGKNRSAQIGSELAGTLMHEFVVHMLRSINGESCGIYEAQHGFDDYADFEEGLGCYVEFLMTGARPDKLDNRQIASSLAIGQLGDHVYDPDELYELLTLRLKLLLKARGMKTSYIKLKIDELKPLVIDRLFRGGLGHGEPYPVYTRDRVYAEGFELCREYVCRRLKNGLEPDTLMNFILSGKFNPTNKKHVEAMHKAQISIS